MKVTPVLTPSSVVLVFDRAEDPVMSISSGEPIYDRFAAWVDSGSGAREVDQALQDLIDTHLGRRAQASSANVCVDLQEKLIEAVNNSADSPLAVNALRLFDERLAANPCESARRNLINYVRHQGLTLTAEGCVVMYKRVREDLRSWFDSTYQYHVSKDATVARDRCLDHPDNAAGFGLHWCTWGKLGSWYGQGRVLEAVLAPEDFTCVPVNAGKLLTHRAFIRCVRPTEFVPETAFVERGKEFPPSAVQLGWVSSSPSPAAPESAPTPETISGLAESQAAPYHEVPKGSEPGAAVDAPAMSSIPERGKWEVNTSRTKAWIIPSAAIRALGIQSGSDIGKKLRVVHTDLRARYVVVTSLSDAELRGLGVLKRAAGMVYEGVSTVDTGRGTAPVPVAVLESARIRDTDRGAVATIPHAGVLEIRLN